MQGKVEEKIEKLEDAIVESSIWEKLNEFLSLHVDFTEEISVSIKDLLVIRRL